MTSTERVEEVRIASPLSRPWRSPRALTPRRLWMQAEKLKVEGNELFKAGKWADAAARYRDAIDFAMEPSYGDSDDEADEGLGADADVRPHGAARGPCPG